MRKAIIYVIDENGCFRCTSHFKTKWGHCQIYVNGKMKGVHRHVYEEMYGFIPDGLVVRHKCDVADCINPEHLEIGTHADNARDMYSRNRSYSRVGENNSCAKLTENEVKEILKALEKGVQGKVLAEKYGVTRSNISRIKYRKAWQGVDNFE